MSTYLGWYVLLNLLFHFHQLDRMPSKFLLYLTFCHESLWLARHQNKNKGLWKLPKIKASILKSRAHHLVQIYKWEGVKFEQTIQDKIEKLRKHKLKFDDFWWCHKSFKIKTCISSFAWFDTHSSTFLFGLCSWWVLLRNSFDTHSSNFPFGLRFWWVLLRKITQ